MNWVALRMLTGDRSKYFGIVFGIGFGTMLMTQQSSLFCGLMRNTTAQIRDFPEAQIWVMAPKSEYIDDVNPMPESELYRVGGVSGVKWAGRYR